MTAICETDGRREAVRQRADLNGLDYLDVGADQRTLTVFFLGKVPQQMLRAQGEETAAYQQRLRGYVRIEGGRRIRGIEVIDVQVQRATDARTGKIDPLADDRMVVRLDRYGDFSTYTLRLAGVAGIDRFYDHLDFSFKVGCPSDFDCAPADTCPPPAFGEPEINYQAKDYGSFRQLLLDRLALIMPDWRERHVPDLGITLVELLAYVGDHLSYYQDAVATEAYLETARQRISVRRHARLVDYLMHEGCNARAFVCIEARADFDLDPASIFFVTGADDLLELPGALLAADRLRELPPSSYERFEPLARGPITLREAHNSISLYTWGQRECCLPRGATSATLRDGDGEGRQLELEVGDLLIFEEVIGPRTGNSADADPAHRHAVRLTDVTPGEDTLFDPPRAVVEVSWGAADALPFALCISATTDAANGCTALEDVSVARGNVVLVDHGQTVGPEDLGVVPCAAAEVACVCAGRPGEVSFHAGRYRPTLSGGPLTWSEPLPSDDPDGGRIASATALLAQNPRAALPAIRLGSVPPAAAADCSSLGPLFTPGDLLHPQGLIYRLRAGRDHMAEELRGRLSAATRRLLGQQEMGDELERAVLGDLAALLGRWEARTDLLGSQRDERHFVVEVDNEGQSHLRFGDGALGQQPEAGAAFFASYRVGNRKAGNVGAEAIRHLVLRSGQLSGGVSGVRNPLPAVGGSEAEPMAEAKLFAPFAFRNDLQRAVTAEDYAHLAQRDFKEVQRAAAVLRWTGSWYEAQVALDPLGSGEASDELLAAVTAGLARYRRIGHDLRATGARYVPLDLELLVCVRPGYLRGHIAAALRDLFSSRSLPDGKLGFFHPDRLTFGDGIYLSQIVAAAQGVAGVESVVVTKLQRLYAPSDGAIERGVLALGPLEVARLASDPDFPEHGRLVLDMRGGR